MLASVAKCGKSWKWGCRGRLALGFKPRCGSCDKKNHMALAGNHHAALAEENHVALGLPLSRGLGRRKAWCSRDAEISLSSLQECRRDAAGRKGVKGFLLVGEMGLMRRCHVVLD